MSTKSYFVNTEPEEVFELSGANSKRLLLMHPNWHKYNCESNYEDLKSVYEFFRLYGKLVGHTKYNNVFVGLTE